MFAASIVNRVFEKILPTITSAIDGKNIHQRTDSLLLVLEELVHNDESCQHSVRPEVIIKLDKTGLIHLCTDEQTLLKLMNIYIRLCECRSNALFYDHREEEQQNWMAVKHLITLLFYEFGDNQKYT